MGNIQLGGLPGSGSSVAPWRTLLNSWPGGTPSSKGGRLLAYVAPVFDGAFYTETVENLGVIKQPDETDAWPAIRQRHDPGRACRSQPKSEL